MIIHRHDSPDGRPQFEQPLCCMDGLLVIIGQQADDEELTHIPVIAHLLQAPFCSQQIIQLGTLKYEF